jgi:hypothetical protein
VDEIIESKGVILMADRSFICIVGGANSARREKVVLTGGALPKIKLSSPRSLPVGTDVIIQNGRNKAHGIVNKCLTDLPRYEMIVEIKAGGQWLTDLVPVASSFDPGVHSVNKFICDEDIVQLMNELAPKTHTTGFHK